MSDEKVMALIRVHVQRYNAIDIMDIYKLLHQAVFGPAQTMKNYKAAQEWLDREIELLKPVQHVESLVESVHPDAEIVRVHLRPYFAVQGNRKKLLESFIQSSKIVVGDPARIAAWWALFQGMTEVNGLLANRFDNRTVSLIGRTRTMEQWPNSPHSPPFDRTYRPLYRVLTRSLADELLKQQNISYTII